DKNAALLATADEIERSTAQILAANAEDVAKAREAGLAASFIDRLRLDEARIAQIAAGIRDIAALDDPVGRTIAAWERPNGLKIERVRTPIGVLGVIYESRPNVTADAAALCLRSGNAAILRCGSDCLESSRAIAAVVARAVVEAGLPADAIQLVPVPDREAVGAILSGLEGAIGLIIPRGGKSLVARVQAEAKAPVLGHLEGLCHTYLDAAADLDVARRVVVNAKMRRVSVCGATETLLVDRAAAKRLLPSVAADLIKAGCELRGDTETRALVPEAAEAAEADWTTEYLAPVLSVRVVDGVA